MRRTIPNAIAASFFCIVFTASLVHAGPATKIVVLLPGQTLSSAGVVGSPLPQQVRDRFLVRVVAVDDSFARDDSYEGPLVGLFTTEAVPVAALRFGSSISGAGAATSLPPGGGDLRLAINGEGYRDYDLAPASTGDEVCQAIVAAIAAGNPGRPLALGCDFDPSTSRYTMFANDGRPLRGNLRQTYFESSITIDPAFGVAPALHLGAVEPPSSDPGDASELVARRLVANPAVDLVFDRGFAAFSVGWNTLADLGSNFALAVDQGPGGLPVLSSTFELQPNTFQITNATAIGDGNGRIHKVRMALSQHVLPSSLADQAASFALRDTGTGTEIPGTSLTAESYDLEGYAADSIEVRFGTGLGRTDVTNVEVRYAPPASNRIQSADGLSALGNGTTPPLKDGAAPVLVTVFPQDLDGNGGSDRVKFFFSEPVAFSAGRGVSKSGFEPVTSNAVADLGLPASLAVAIGGEMRFLPLHHPTDPGATSIPGGSAVADAITIAVRSVDRRPAFANFTCSFTDGRYVLRAGIPLRSVVVVPSPLPDDASSLLKLGVANGGIERPGSGSAVADPGDLVILDDSLRRSTIEGLDETAFQIGGAGDEVTIELTNQPGSGTATPTYIWRDNGDLGFVSDRAAVPNLAVPPNNVALPEGFHPSALIRIRDTDSNPDDGVIRKSPGQVILDASQTIPPLLPGNVPTDLKFTWTQVEGPLAVIEDPESDETETQLLSPGTYVFRLTITVLDDGAPPAFNPYLHGDGTLAKTIAVEINPGPAEHIVVLLPNESLVEGVATHEAAIDGAAGIGTPGVPYPVRLVCTDAGFNAVPCPGGASASIATTDPADVEPPAQPLAPGGATFVMKPATPGTWSVDDVIDGFTETGDVAREYVVGSAWNAHASKLAGQPTSLRLTWAGDPRPVTWNVYVGALPFLDVDHDGLPDQDYGACATGQDPNPADTSFDDPAIPATGSGRFYVGTMVLGGQETAPGVTASGLVRQVGAACP